MEQLGAKKLTQILESISDGVLFESIDHTIYFVNDAFCETFNIPVDPKSLFGQSCSDSAIQAAPLLLNAGNFLLRIKMIYEKLEPCKNETIFFCLAENT